MPLFKDDLSAGLKAGMRRLAASVCVISFNDTQGRRQAMTATAVSSLSDNPPALLVCINKNSAASVALNQRLPFCVNVLHESQADISALCAAKPDALRFSKGDWQVYDNSLPYLADAEVIFVCTTDEIIDYGSHLIAIGKLVQVQTRDGEAKPLLYMAGQYQKLLP